MIAFSNSWIEDCLLVKLILHRFASTFHRNRQSHQCPVIYAVTLQSPRCNGNSGKLQFFLQAQIYELPKNKRFYSLYTHKSSLSLYYRQAIGR